MKVCYLCFRAFSFARTITAGSMDMNIIAMINSLRFCCTKGRSPKKYPA